MSIKISVIIPIYNTERYLDDCILSVINQSYKELQIILVDDGSTDNSLNICHKYMLMDNRIEVFSKLNGGLSSARNFGLTKAKGQYIYFLDSDDELELYAFESMVNAINKYDLDLVIFDAYCIDENGNQLLDNININRYYRKDNEDNVLSGKERYINFIKTGSFISCVPYNLIKKELVTEIQFGNFIHEDELFTIQVMLKSQKSFFLPRKLYRRRIRDGSIMTKKISRYNFLGYFNVLKALCAIYPRFDELTARCITIYISAVDRYRQLEPYEKKLISKEWNELFNLVKKNNFFNSINIEKQCNEFLLSKSDDVLFECIDCIRASYAKKKKENELIKVNKLLEDIRKEKNIAIIVGSPNSGNLVDLLDILVLKKYINNYLSKYRIIEIPYNMFVQNILDINKVLTKQSVVFFSKFNLEDSSYILIKKNLNEFTSNLAVFFNSFCPDLVEDFFYTFLKKHHNKINNKKNLTFFTDSLRDYNYLKNNSFGDNIIYSPNLALTYKLSFQIELQRYGCLVIEDFNLKKNMLKEKALTNILSFIKDNNLPYVHGQFDCLPVAQNQEELLVIRKLKEISGFKIVITDNYESIIFCALTNTPCIILGKRECLFDKFPFFFWENNRFIKFYNNEDSFLLFDWLKKIIRNDYSCRYCSSVNVELIDYLKKISNRYETT